MEEVTLKLKTNCRNVVELEGYPDKIRFRSAAETENKKDILSFRLQSINNKDSFAYVTPIVVFAYDNRAKMIGAWLKKTLLITVTGKLRLTKHGHIVIATYIEKSQPEWADVTLEVGDEN